MVKSNSLSQNKYPFEKNCENFCEKTLQRNFIVEEGKGYYKKVK